MHALLSHERYFHCREPFTATIECSKWYIMGEEIACRFSITNNHPINDYYVLKWFTPLEGLKYAYMSIITMEGKDLKYDSVMINRDPTRASSSAYQLLKAGHTLNAEIDLSTAYAINEAGKYTAQLQTKLYYHPEVECAATSTDLEQRLESNSVTFLLFEGHSPRKTLGEVNRQEATMQQLPSGDNINFVGGTDSQRSLTREIHKASFYYIGTALYDIYDNIPHYVKWFGAREPDHVRFVTARFFGMLNTMLRDVITYAFSESDPNCGPDTVAYTFLGARKIYLCSMYSQLEEILPADKTSGMYTKLCVLVHELTHAIVFTDDIVYPLQECLDLAKNDPLKAITNANNYCYFSETTNIFDYGFDSMAKWSDGNTYVTRGNTYIRYSDTSTSARVIDDGYPQLIYRSTHWSLPESLTAEIDSMTTLLDGKNYITMGRYFKWYSSKSNSSSRLLDLSDPSEGGHTWGNLPNNFKDGFDSMTVFPNNKTYVTKGNQYICYSDNMIADPDPGYPRLLQKNWRNLPPSFASGFDSMAKLEDDKVYVTKGKEYIRYTGSIATVDEGYPRPIKGDWGTINFPNSLS